MLATANKEDSKSCTFTSTSDGKVTQGEVCTCVQNAKTGATKQRMAHVFNTLLGGAAKMGFPTAEGKCPGATYQSAAESYVCTKPTSAPGTCPCPSTVPTKSWPGSVSSKCQEFVVEAAHEGMCLPSSNPKTEAIHPNCQLQSCPCAASSSVQINQFATQDPMSGATVSGVCSIWRDWVHLHLRNF